VKHLPVLAIALALVGCEKKSSKDPAPAPVTTGDKAEISRTDFNRIAVRENLGVYWIADANQNQRMDPDEVTGLLFYPPGPVGQAAYDQIAAAAKAPPTTDHRIELVQQDLDQGRATLVLTDLKPLSEDDRKFVTRMQKVAEHIDAIFSRQTGAAALADQVAKDAASQSLFRRNWGPACVAPATEKDPDCSAIPGAPKPLPDVYPVEVQQSPTFCKDLAARPDAKTLLAPFVVVRGSGDALTAVPYTEAYQDEMAAISAELTAAADAFPKDPSEERLVAYLRAAAASFLSNDWQPADEAWAKMNAENSKWYLRVAPDEVYFDPCAQKAGFHMTFARINQGSLAWQNKLVPVQQEMEAAVAARAGAPYVARTVTFHLPDFIDIIINAGDDRDPLGATIGQSLPNWGPVANEGRGRTVAMSNLYTDPDSDAARRGQAESLLDAASAKAYTDDVEPGLLSTILHEATHNLGPHSEYAVDGKTDDQIFGGPMASLFEELKAQTGGLFLIDFLHGRGLISDELAAQTYVDSIVWTFGHISGGMYTATGDRKAYSQLSAIQVGFLMDHGALTWDDATPAANGNDKGAFTIHVDKLPAVVDEMMTVVGGIKARGDKAAAEALTAKYVDGPTVPHKVIAERMLRFPRASFVYALGQ
jgi:hypothetical protein